MTALKITKDLLKPWSPCSDGYKWFVAKFPQGAEYTAVQKALRDDKRFDDARWLTDHVWNNLVLDTPAITTDVTTSQKDEALEIISETTSFGVEAPTAEELKTGTVTENDGGKHDAQIGSSGNDAQIGSSGYGAKIGSSGYGAKINATGTNAVIACASPDSRARTGANGVIALPWFDETGQRMRIAVGYIGEDLKVDTWYEVKNGVFVEVAA